MLLYEVAAILVVVATSSADGDKLHEIVLPFLYLMQPPGFQCENLTCAIKSNKRSGLSCCNYLLGNVLFA